jgi:heme exporter protein A
MVESDDYRTSMKADHDTNDAAYALEAIRLTVVRRTPVLNDLSLKVPSGESIAIMGPNGSGKTTLLKCLAGAVRPTHGLVHWFGGADSRSFAVRRQIGFVGHETGLYAELSSLENLCFWGRMYGVLNPTERACNLLSETGLEPKMHQPVARLSQGERQRVAIVRGLLNQPQLLLLDEPFVNLDQEGRRWLERILQESRRAGRTICFASHDRAESRELADRIVWLEKGRVTTMERVNPARPLQLRSA